MFVSCELNDDEINRRPTPKYLSNNLIIIYVCLCPSERGIVLFSIIDNFHIDHHHERWLSSLS